MSEPAVIFMHGAFCGGWTFERFRKPFEARGLRCLAPDMRGHAPRDKKSVIGLSMQDYAADLVTLIKAEPVPPVVIGHSLGGLVAQMAATRAPVSALILLAPSAPWGVPGGSIEEAISAVSLYAMGPFWAQAVEPDYTTARAYSLDRLSSADRRKVFGRMRGESGRALWESLNWWLDPMMTTSVPPEAIKAPVLAMAGEKDRINPPATVGLVARRLGGNFMTLAGMSHWLVAEPGWEQAADACLTWMDGLALPKAS